MDWLCCIYTFSNIYACTHIHMQQQLKKKRSWILKRVRWDTWKGVDRGKGKGILWNSIIIKKNELIRKHKKTLASQSNHEKKKKTLVGVSPYLLCLKLYCRATVMKRQNQHKNRHLDQWNTSSNYKPTHLQPLDFWGKKRCQDILWWLTLIINLIRSTIT